MEADIRSEAGISAYLDGFVSYMRGLGYTFGEKTVCPYRRMVAFMEAKARPGEPLMSRDLVLDWVANGGGGHPRSCARRASQARRFASYLVRCGHSDCYVIPAGDSPRDSTEFVPYIFTHDEIAAVTRAFDSMRQRRNCSSRHWSVIYPTLFRIIYGCGLRVSEAAGLAMGDVDLVEGILFIRRSKNEDSRYVPMHESLTEYLRGYVERVGASARAKDEPFFLSPKGGFYAEGSLRATFQSIYAEAGVVNQEGLPPRIHDLRHTFAVHALQRAEERGVPAHAFLPTLAAYMGHKHIKAAEYYLHLTREGQRHIVSKMMGSYAGLYKEVASVGEEEQ